jgi:outer membrane protein assembly factor BamB
MMPTVRPLLLALACVPVLAAEPAAPTDSASDWPHLRGPACDGTSPETGLADTWPGEGPPVLWMRPIGKGYSGFTAVGGLVYTQTQTDYGQYVVCLEGDTGRAVWETRTGWPYEDLPRYPGPRATPTVHDGRVYFAGPRGRVGCLRAEDGCLLWSVDVIAMCGGTGSDFGYACSPLVEDGKVILPVGGPGASLVALDAGTGTLLWSSGDGAASYASALPVTFRGRRLVVVLLRNAVAGFDLATGSPLWKHALSHGYDEHAAWPLYADPHVLISQPFKKGATCYRLGPPGGARTGPGPPAVKATRIWKRGVFSNDTASSLVLDGHVYGFDLQDIQARPNRPSKGAFKCVEIATGEARWASERPGHATVVAADGKLYLFNDRGEAVLAAASPDGYDERGRVHVFLDEICWTAPALHRGRLYLRTPTRAACLYVGDPERLDAGLRAASRPAAALDRHLPEDKLAGLLGAGPDLILPVLGIGTLAFWLAACLGGAFGAAALVAAGVGRLRPPAARGAFWALAAVIGLAGTTLIRRAGGGFVFTLPVALYVAYQMTLLAAVRAAGRRGDRRASWGARGAVLLFLLLCAGYFHVCRRFGLDQEWVFLFGFLPAWPVALVAARRLVRPGPVWRDLGWAALGYTVFFASVSALLLWVRMPRA